MFQVEHHGTCGKFALWYKILGQEGVNGEFEINIIRPGEENLE